MVRPTIFFFLLTVSVLMLLVNYSEWWGDGILRMREAEWLLWRTWENNASSNVHGTGIIEKEEGPFLHLFPLYLCIKFSKYHFDRKK